MDIAARASHALQWFERAIRPDRTGYYHLRDDAPAEAFELVDVAVEEPAERRCRAWGDRQKAIHLPA